MSAPRQYPGDGEFHHIGQRLAELERQLSELRRHLGIPAAITGTQPDDRPAVFDDGNGAIREHRR